MDDSPTPCYYKTLGVPKDATLATIRKARRKLLLLWHPDRVREESEKTQRAEPFHQIQQAYEVLSDENRRQRYDEKIRLAELKAQKTEEQGSLLPRRSCKAASNDSGYGTGASSVGSSSARQRNSIQSYPVPSYPVPNYPAQFSYQESALDSYSNHEVPTCKVFHAAPLSSPKHQKEPTIR